MADKFVRVRLAQIENSNLKIFDFDYDLTFMIFFLSPQEKVYSRYGGRCEQGPDERQSLAGLRYTMQSVLAEHDSKKKRFAPSQTGKPFYIREIAPRGLGRCIHCHQAKEVIYDRLDRAGRWEVDLAFRYPLPENLGVKLEVDRGNVVQAVAASSPGAGVGLQAGDQIRSLNDVPIHSFGDAQFALDRAPKLGAIDVTWQRSGREMRGKIKLYERWRRTDVSWRPSMQKFVASAHVYGKDLTDAEKKALGLEPGQLAFRQKDKVADQAKKAGIRPGDVILGIDGLDLRLPAYKFLYFVRSNYVKGEKLTLLVVRNGRRLKVPMHLE